MRLILVFVSAAAVLFRASSAVACPLCPSETGQLVRNGIFNSNFGENLFTMLMPFLVIGGVVAPIYRGTASHHQSGNNEQSLLSTSKGNGR